MLKCDFEAMIPLLSSVSIIIKNILKDDIYNDKT